MGAVNILVTYASGRPASGVKVVGEVGGMLGGMTAKLSTNADGHACLTWKSNTSSLANVYIDGRKHSGPFRSGETYAFSVR